jgi:membrane-associated PAP2 superfamily phosphatase
MITNIPGDWHRYLKQTFRTESIAPALAIGIMTVGMVATDEETWRMSEQWYHSSGSVKTWSEVFTSIGDGKSQFGLAAAFGLYGWIRDDSKALRTASQIVQAVLASGSVVQVLKHTTGRESPFVESTPGGAWRLFPNQIEYHKHVANYDAFPSGHLCTSVATVVVVAENYPEITWIKPVGFTVCALVAVGMVNRGIHWYSDYPLGAVIGYSFGMIAAHPESRTATPAQSSELTVLPFVHGGGGGLHLSWQF